MTRKSLACGEIRIVETKKSSTFFLEITHFPYVT